MIEEISVERRKNINRRKNTSRRINKDEWFLSCGTKKLDDFKRMGIKRVSSERRGLDRRKDI